MNKETVRKLNEACFDNRRMFSFPHELIDDPSLSKNQKRAILAEWASDASAIESFPTLRLLPGTTFPVTLSSIMDALVRLDGDAESEDSPVAPTLRASRRQMSRSAPRQGANCVAYQFGRTRDFNAANARHASALAR